MEYTLEFERPVNELENQIKELKEASVKQNIDITKEVKALQKKVDEMIHEIYTNLSSWDRVQLSRHPMRPHTIDYINTIVEEFHEVHGDRAFGDDKSVIAGFGYLENERVCVVGIEKGRKTKEKIERNFGMPNPEGYRKALRVMKLAANFNIPVVTFIDTPGAYPGLEAEERGQSHAIADNIAEMFDLPTPIISVVIGEGGSGGALGIAVADKVLMMEYSIYTVISPESCASILWADPKMAEVAANSLKLGPEQSLKLKVIDGVIEEPAGGAHKDAEEAGELLKSGLLKHLKDLKSMDSDKMLQARFEKFRAMGNITIEGFSKKDKENFKIY